MLNTESVQGESGNLGHFHPWFRPSGKRKRNNEKPNRTKQVCGCFSCGLKRFLIYPVPSGITRCSTLDCCNNRPPVGKKKRRLQVRRGGKGDPACRLSLQQAEGPGRWQPGRAVRRGRSGQQ